MIQFSLKNSLLTLAFLALPVFIVLWIIMDRGDASFQSKIASYSQAGKKTLESLASLPAQNFTENKDSFNLIDKTPDGIDIKFANEKPLSLEEQKAKDAKVFALNFPKDYSKPLEVKLDDKRSIMVTDANGNSDYTGTLYTEAPTSIVTSLPNQNLTQRETLYTKFKDLLFPKKTDAAEAKYLTYTDKDQRKLVSYVYQKDQATGEKKLKEWVLYKNGNGNESESYSFQNAKLKQNDDGSVSGYYFGDQDLKNQTAKDSVDPSLLARAQRAIAADMGEDILSGNHTPDFVIPKPYYINSKGDQTNLDWKVNVDTNTITVSFLPQSSDYPLALDPTLSFTAPGQSNSGSVITGEATSNYFGIAMAVGDFNNDGKADLAVGANTYSGFAGRVYIFYNDGSISSNAAVADVIITGTSGIYFGATLISGDWNADGKTDLAVGATGNTGTAYIFYGGRFSATKSYTSADVSIVGETTSDFGISLASGDFDADGKTDLAVGADAYGGGLGRAYIFYGSSSLAGGNAVTIANKIITGDTDPTDGCYMGGNFGSSLAAGDFNADGKTDLAAGGKNFGNYYDAIDDLCYSSNNGRAYIFYNGSIPTTAATAAVIIDGSGLFGTSLVSGDFNADGKTDLVVGAPAGTWGWAYLFYADGTTNFGTAACTGTAPALCLASNADVSISGQGGSFGISLASGDFNADGRIDLVVGASAFTSNTGRAYIFYNDGSIPTGAASADVFITGEASGNYFGADLVAGDFNADGKTDLAVGAYGYSSNTGRAYIFYSQNGQINTNQSTTGNATGDAFGTSLTSGDFNADGRVDLAVGAPGYSTNTGRVYLFYNDGSIPTAANSADAILVGEATDNYFGAALASGDFDANGKTDLAVGAYGYSTNTGRAYLFYNDGSYGAADVTFTGETTSNYFGAALASGDFDANGKTDLVVGAYGYNPGSVANTGRAYIFYNDGSYTTADVEITGDTLGGNNRFGSSFSVGDFDANGKTDLVVSSPSFNNVDTGRVYIFYNDGSFGTVSCTTDCLATSADIVLHGEVTGGGLNTYFGTSLVSGDFNSDNTIDLAVSASVQSTVSVCVDWDPDDGDCIAWENQTQSEEHTYIFYNDGSFGTVACTTGCLATNADVIVTGYAFITTNNIAPVLAAGDFNFDGRTDLAVGDYAYGSVGQVFIFYNDGSFGTVACTTGCLTSNADVTISNRLSGYYFGAALVAGDFNADGRTDLIVGAYGYSTSTGRTYIYQTQENYAWKIDYLAPGQPLRTGTQGVGQEMQILGETGSPGSQFGGAMTAGDFNADGKTDLAVGANAYSSNTGRVYIFYNTGSLPTMVANADATITGEAISNYFGSALAAGDFNNDGKTDLAVGAYGYSNLGRSYLFYNDDAYPALAAAADGIFTGTVTNGTLGCSLAVGDFNADGKTDLAVGSFGSTSVVVGHTYIFYQGSSLSTNLASAADVILTGIGTGDGLGFALAAADFNADGKTDLAVGASTDYYTGLTTHVYIFYQGSSLSTNSASAADIVLTSSATDYFGDSLVAGDFNADGKTDLAASSYLGGSVVYVFYQGSSLVTNLASAADVSITGSGGNYFGSALAAGDFNADGRTDLAVGADLSNGSAFIFYNDGSIPTTSTTADVIINGETTSKLGSAMAAGDFNADGKTDLAVGASAAFSRGKTHIYTFNDPVLTGEAANDEFSYALAAGDFNADGRVDLAVGMKHETDNISAECDNGYDLITVTTGFTYGSGRAYVFYNDGSIPATAATADVILTGEAGSDFGRSLVAGDFDANGKTDLAVGAYQYSSRVGRAYVFYNGTLSAGGTIAATAADVILTGAASDTFGVSLAAGDWNADGKTDLAVAADQESLWMTSPGGTCPDEFTGWNYGAGKIYLFYNGFTTGPAASTANVIINGATSLSHASYQGNLGSSMISGDWNADGKTDLAVGASGINTVYVFNADGTTNDFGTATCSGTPATCSAADADVILTGEVSGNRFGYALTAGDFNADSKTDLVIGANAYSSNTGRAYIFNGGSLATNSASAADTIITGEATSSFGTALSAGDFNFDGRIDLAVGALIYSTSTGRAYIFYNDGSVPTTAATADVIMNGYTTSNDFGFSLVAGDFNADSKTDLAVGSFGYNPGSAANTGRVNIYTTETALQTIPDPLLLRGTVKMRGTIKVR